MTNNRIEEHVCIICGMQDVPERGKLIEVRTKKSRLALRAHEECIEGLYLLLSKKKKKIPTSKTTTKTCRQLLEELYQEGWFATSRKFVDVIQRIEQSGYNFPKSTVANGLRSLVRAGLLIRRGKKGDYSYIQRQPPEG